MPSLRAWTGDCFLWPSLSGARALATAGKRTRHIARQTRLRRSRVVEGTTFFFHRSGGVKKTAAKLVPKGLTQTRAAVKSDAVRSLFGDSSETRGAGLVSVRITKRQAV